jgi:hypothetical protein
MKRFTAQVLSMGMVLAAAGLLTAAAVRSAPLLEQSIELHPGWNAVFLEVTPEPNDMDSVFQDLPVSSVWHWSGGDVGVQFIQDPGEELIDVAGWHVWFPPSRGEPEFLNSLFAVLANRAYLIEVAGESDVTLTVSGTPSLRRPKWLPDSFNLTGFTVDPGDPPTYGAFFSHSAAHADQAVYRLGSDGTWQMVSSLYGTPMQPGEAFWIYTQGISDYSGPMSVKLDFGDELDFGKILQEREIRLRNHSSGDKTVTFDLSSGGAGVPLSRISLNAEGRTEWPSIQVEPTASVSAGKEKLIRLAVRREQLSSDSVGSILEVADGQGSLVRLPVTAEVWRAPGPGDCEHTGLWVGTTSVNKVSQAQIPAAPEFTEPQPTGREFFFRLILHVDGSCQTRLLKEVIQMENGSGEPVLITDDSLIPDFFPSSTVGGEPYSQRISSAAFDFEGADLNMSGSFSMYSSLSGTINLGPNHPTNPFKHRYHPDHNNLDELGFDIVNEDIMESYRIIRRIDLVFSDTDPRCPECPAPPGWGASTMGGTYEERLDGLHRNPIYTAGTFEVKKITDIAELNPGVSP